MLIFYPDTHTYEIDGRKIPSVTQVLNEWIECGDLSAGGIAVNRFTGKAVDGATFLRARERGSTIHRLVHEDILEVLDESVVGIEDMKAVTQFRDWRSIVTPEIVAVERKLYSPSLDACGTLDLMCKIGRHLTLIDMKTGASGLVGPQTAAYAKMYKEETGTRDQIVRYYLHLPRDGSKWDFVPLTSKDDWPFWSACHYQYKFIKGRK